MNSPLALDLDKVYFISIFDHWLSEFEADHCAILSYSIALNHNKLKDYLVGEAQFISFYQSIDHKVIVFYDNKNKKEMSVFCDEFISILRDGLRERKFYRFMFEKYQIIIESGYDRTDRILVTKETDMDFIQKQADNHHLFIIDCMNYNEYIHE